MPTRALITGITGQAGSYLAELLLSKGYAVHGILRRSSSFNTGRIDHLYADPHTEGCRLFLHRGDITDGPRIRELVDKIKPDELYNLAAQSHVAVSFEEPIYTTETIVNGTLNVLEAIRSSGLPIKMYQASSSEMFGSSPAPQDEDTPFKPRSPYACAKVAAHHLCQHYQEAYGMFICCGILFNHESPRRGENFVTRKIIRAATRIKLGLQSNLYLGDLAPRRDWGFAGDYVKAMWAMLQQEWCDDFVIATGRSERIDWALNYVFGKLGIDPQEQASRIVFDERQVRPTDVMFLLGDSSKAARVLGWEPETSLEQLLDMMIESDMRLAKNELLLRESLCSI